MPKATKPDTTGCARTPTSRRRLLSGAAAALTGAGFAAAVLSPDPVWGEPVQVVGPDDELIAACGEYVTAVNAYNAPNEREDPANDEMWAEMKDLEDWIEETPSRTLAGLAAKARVVALLARNPDGTHSFGDSYTGRWPEQVVRDVLRLVGEEVPA